MGSLFLIGLAGLAGLAVSGVNWALVAWFAIVVLTTSIIVLHCAILEPISGSYFKPIFLIFSALCDFPTQDPVVSGARAPARA